MWGTGAREELTSLRREIEFVCSTKGSKKKEWPDYNIDDWPVKEIIKTAIRKDGLAMMSSRIYCVTTSVQLMMTTFWENLGCGALNHTTLSVKDLQNVLREDQSMSPQCFNIAVRFPAYHEFRKLTYCSNNIPKHFMDLCFCVSFLPSFTHPQCYSHHWKSEFSSSNYLSKFPLTQIMWLSVITRKKT